MRALLAPAVAAVLLAGCASPEPSGGAGGAPTVRATGGGTTNLFEPASVEVDVGGSVRWIDESGSHTVTFREDVGGNGTRPDSGNLDPGQSFALAFPRAGTFAYRCIYHSSGFNATEGMVGVVVAR